MGKIPVEGLIKQFQTMYIEHWDYVWGAARKGCVDCSGAFVYAYNQYGKKIAHGSNSIGHKYVGELLPISKAEPGMAAFKVREWKESERGNAWYGKSPGDIHHIGLVDEDAGYVLNAKGQKSGFCRDKLTTKSGWDYVAYLSDVEYSGGGGGGGTVVSVIISGGNPNATIRMRSKPSTSGTIIAEIPQGSTAELIGTQDNWSNIVYAGKTGWTMSQFVHTDSPEPSGDTITVPKADLEKIYDQIGDWLGLRG